MVAVRDDNHAHSVTSVLDEDRFSEYNSIYVELSIPTCLLSRQLETDGKVAKSAGRAESLVDLPLPDGRRSV